MITGGSSIIVSSPSDMLGKNKLDERRNTSENYF